MARGRLVWQGQGRKTRGVGMRVAIIGATGHIGGYLVPRLVEAGHDVIALSRGGQPRFREHAA
jgi:NAD(P)-dependent dehydrogenase (short-subunit alcohol dehydrogenase family)